MTEVPDGAQQPAMVDQGPGREDEASLTPRAALEKLLGGEKLGSVKAWVVVEQAELERTNAQVWSWGAQGETAAKIEVAQAITDYSNAKAADRRGRFGENSEVYEAVAETFTNDVFPSYVRRARLDHPGKKDGFDYTILAADKVDEDLKAIARGVPAEGAAPQPKTSEAEVADAAPAPEPEPETGRDFLEAFKGSGYALEYDVRENDYIDMPRTDFGLWVDAEDRDSLPQGGTTRVRVVGIERDERNVPQYVELEADGHRIKKAITLFTRYGRAQGQRH